MMDSSTQQLAHKVALGLAAFMLSVAFIFILAVAWQQGDGAAREMVGLLQPTIITTFGGLLTYLTVTAGVNAWVAVKTARSLCSCCSSCPWPVRRAERLVRGP